MVNRQPPHLPPPRTTSRGRRAASLESSCGPPRSHGDSGPMALSATSAVFYAGALLAAYKRRFWPMMFFGGTSYLLKLWFLDRMTSLL